VDELEIFDKIKIGIASDERVREWSKGEVKKPETINYRTLKPEKDGLFCERIFGPTKDWECHCGKYKRVRYKGIVCDRCGVEVTKSKVRRERMGHIELAAPVAHIWYFKGIPSRIALLLDVSPRNLEKVIYFASYIVTDKGTSSLTKTQVLSEKEYHEAEEKYGKGSFKAEMGAEAIRKLLEEIDIEKLSEKLKKELEKLKKMKSQKLNYMQIKLNGKIEDISAMLIGAERYALGRKTYIVQWTCEFIGSNLHLLTEKDKQVMIRDIENPISYGDECDKECWMQLLKILKMEVKENV
jgi:DNA-directed RNA polymerase beta' subunit